MEDSFPERLPSVMLEVAWKGQLFNTWDSSGLWWRLPEQVWYNRDRQPTAISGFDAYTSRPLTLVRLCYWFNVVRYKYFTHHPPLTK